MREAGSKWTTQTARIKSDEYSKVIAKWGTFYFKNGQSITEMVWSRDTEE